MTAPLPFTGERFTPEIRGAIWHEHWHRYCVVASLVAGKRVLDAACGEGYGAAMLCATARSVVAVDVDAQAIRHAASRYAGQDTLTFVRATCAALPLADASIDFVVSFETIEHLAEQEAMLAEFRRVLVPGGTLVLSSPNKSIYAAEDGSHNAFHVRELDEPELKALLDPMFPRQRWYGQRVMAQSLMWTRDGEAPQASSLALDESGIRALREPAPPMYFIVVCGTHGAALPALPSFSTFDDGAQSIFRDYRRALDVETVLRWNEVDARKVAEERLAQAIAAVNAAASARQRADVLLERVASLEGELADVHRRYETANAALTHACAETERARIETVVERDVHAARADALEGERMRLHERLVYRESARGWASWPLSFVKRALARQA